MAGGIGPAEKMVIDAADEPLDHTVDETGGQWSWPESDDPPPATRDLVSALIADISRVGLLSREEEEALAQRIALQRRRILKLLRGERRLVGMALRGQGRGTVHPDHDFREREALRVLKCAKRVVRARPRRADTRRVQSFIRLLESEIATYRGLRDRMMTANVRLVMMLARRYHHPTLSLLDLVQEGVFGLLRAVEKYEPSRQIKFSTYAVWWIWQQIARAADCQGAMIRTPVHWNQFRRKLRRSDALDTEGRENWIAAHGLSLERATAMTQSFHCVSLATPLRDDDDERTIADTLADPEANPESTFVESDLTDRLAVAVRGLPAREARILQLRFGLNGNQCCTLEEIGTEFGVSRERVRQLEARALKQMRVLCAAQGLAEFLN